MRSSSFAGRSAPSFGWWFAPPPVVPGLTERSGTRGSSRTSTHRTDSGSGSIPSGSRLGSTPPAAVFHGDRADRTGADPGSPGSASLVSGGPPRSGSPSVRIFCPGDWLETFGLEARRLVTPAGHRKWHSASRELPVPEPRRATRKGRSGSGSSATIPLDHRPHREPRWRVGRGRTLHELLPAPGGPSSCPMRSDRAAKAPRSSRRRGSGRRTACAEPNVQAVSPSDRPRPRGSGHGERRRDRRHLPARHRGRRARRRANRGRGVQHRVPGAGRFGAVHRARGRNGGTTPALPGTDSRST